MVIIVKNGVFVEKSLSGKATLLLRDLQRVVIRSVVRRGADVEKGDLSVG